MTRAQGGILVWLEREPGLSQRLHLTPAARPVLVEIHDDRATMTGFLTQDMASAAQASVIGALARIKGAGVPSGKRERRKSPDVRRHRRAVPRPSRGRADLDWLVNQQATIIAYLDDSRLMLPVCAPTVLLLRLLRRLRNAGPLPADAHAAME